MQYIINSLEAGGILDQAIQLKGKTCMNALDRADKSATVLANDILVSGIW